MSTHPELREVCNDFLSSILLDKPADAYVYAREYFHPFNPRPAKYKPLVIVGPSGVGKHTLLTESAMKNYGDVFELCKSRTSRSVKKNTNDAEKEPHRYIYDVKDFKTCIQSTNVRGVYYGYNPLEITEIEKQSKIPILELNSHGALQLVDAAFSANYVYIYPKNVDQIRSQIANRIDDTEDQFKSRLNTAIKEIEEANKLGIFNNFIVNEDIGQAKEQLETLINALYFQEIAEIREGKVNKEGVKSSVAGVKIGITDETTKQNKDKHPEDSKKEESRGDKRP